MSIARKLGKCLCAVGLLACALVGVAAPSHAQATDPFIGEIMTVTFNFCPTGWEALNGQLLPISQNETLYNLIGTTYGGDGVTTFALPKARPIITANGVPMTQCIALVGVFPSRD